MLSPTNSLPCIYFSWKGERNGEGEPNSLPHFPTALYRFRFLPFFFVFPTYTAAGKESRVLFSRIPPAMADGVAFSGCSGGRESLLPLKSSYQRSFSHASDELKSFRSCLRWLCIDHSDSLHAAISWFVFLILSFVVPLASHFIMSYSPSRRAYDSVVQIALSGSAALSYLSLSTFVRRHGLRRFLFLDKLRLESERVRLGYTNQLNRSFRILSVFVLPCFAGEVVYKLAWYLSGEERVPPGLFFMGNAVLAESVFAFLELASWIYRTAIFFVVCVLFRLMCYLQILRLEDFAGAFSDGANVACILRAHLRIRRELRIISHRYRIFNVYCVVIVTVSQFVTLLVTTRPSAVVNFFNAGEIAVSSFSSSAISNFDLIVQFCCSFLLFFVLFCIKHFNLTLCTISLLISLV